MQSLERILKNEDELLLDTNILLAGFCFISNSSEKFFDLNLEQFSNFYRLLRRKTGKGLTYINNDVRGEVAGVFKKRLNPCLDIFNKDSDLYKTDEFKGAIADFYSIRGTLANRIVRHHVPSDFNILKSNLDKKISSLGVKSISDVDFKLYLDAIASKKTLISNDLDFKYIDSWFKSYYPQHTKLRPLLYTPKQGTCSLLKREYISNILDL